MRRVHGFRFGFSFRFMVSLLVLFGILLGNTACTRVRESLPRDELVVAVRDTPAFLQGEDAGFERDLIDTFAQELGFKVRIIRVHDHDELIELLREGKAHFAASATVLEHLDGIRYTAPLRESQQVIVQSAAALSVDEPEKLEGHQIEVLEGSPQALELNAWNVQNTSVNVNLGVMGNAHAAETTTATSASTSASTPKDKPHFTLSGQHGMNEIDLLERVSEHKSELAATDRLSFDIASNFYPDIQIAQPLEGRVRFAWAFPEEGSQALFDQAQQFIARIRQDGSLARLDDRYFGHIHRLDAYSIASFLERVDTLLPRLRQDFITAQNDTGIDWRLLAAVAYQESMWNPLATSPTNVRGIMMLTEETADRLKVTNRLDARQSIRAGAKYLSDLIDELPNDIPQPDRTWMGIAAYNLGQGHMNGARAIAKTLKRDSTSWYEMKAVLPLMAREEYYRRLKSGRARGGEAVIMVENIRKFYDILARFELPMLADSGAGTGRRFNSEKAQAGTSRTGRTDKTDKTGRTMQASGTKDVKEMLATQWTPKKPPQRLPSSSSPALAKAQPALIHTRKDEVASDSSPSVATGFQIAVADPAPSISSISSISSIPSTTSMISMVPRASNPLITQSH